MFERRLDERCERGIGNRIAMIGIARAARRDHSSNRNSWPSTKRERITPIERKSFVVAIADDRAKHRIGGILKANIDCIKRV